MIVLAKTKLSRTFSPAAAGEKVPKADEGVAVRATARAENEDDVRL